MNREIHVRFWEGLRVRLPRATHLAAEHGGRACSSPNLLSGRSLVVTELPTERRLNPH